MASSAISLQPLSSGPQFNWFFLLELLVCGILTLFFFFYFNRFIATLVSYGIRAYTWHYYRAYVDIQAFQVSLLGGRIFFKGIRYHGENETILIQRGHITWNYWMRTVRTLDLTRSRTTTGPQKRTSVTSDEHLNPTSTDGQVNGAEESGSLKAEISLPCRITVTLSGLEWFVYNRTPAYDFILSGFAPSAGGALDAQDGRSSRTSAATTSREASENDLAGFKNTTPKTSSSSGAPSVRSRGHRMSTGFSSIQDSSTSKAEALESAWAFLQFLPIQIDCTKGAIVVGNECTHSLLTVTFDKGNGLIDATDAGPLDIYRQVLRFDFSHPVVQFRPNPDFKQEQLLTAQNIEPFQHDESEPKSKWSYRMEYLRRKRELWHSLGTLIPYFQKSVESFHEKGTNTTSTSHIGFPMNNQWVGLTRYLDETVEDRDGWNAVEYARYSTIIDCPSLSLTYYWDIPGKVTTGSQETNSSVRKESGDINGGTPPAWGVDVKIKNGTINYGPWADRERVRIQNVFFPNNFRSAQAEEALKPGSFRRATKFKFVLEITDETTLRIPTREESKDWQWKGRADALRDASKLKKGKSKKQSRGKDGEKTNISPEIRPFGWLTLRIAQDSTVTYDMDMVASNKGFSNQLRLDLRDCKLSSSVNHGLLWQSSRQIISCDLSTPLIWNALRTWSFNFVNHDLQLFLLRDHIFLIQDLVNDWTSGSTTEYYTFVPFVYNIQLFFIDLHLYMNVNESNIINNPSDLDDNNFIVIKAPNLVSNISIPSDKFKAEQSVITFDVDAQDCVVDLVTPLWHTIHTFLTEDSLGWLSRLTIDGTYSLNSGSSIPLDTFTMNITGDNPRCYLYGFLIRYFMKIRENYLGEDMHFRTLEEFQGAVNTTESKGFRATTNPANPIKKNTELDVVINIIVNNPCSLFPTSIYNHSRSLELKASSLDIELRATSYYMDLQVDLTPTEVSLESIQSDGRVSTSKAQVFIDGISIYSHRLFGLPPTEPTYVCNWDFEVGKIVGECSTKFLNSAAAAIQSLAFTFEDEENSFPSLHSVIQHDITFLRAKVASIHMSILTDQSALVLGSGTILFTFNDWSRSRFSKRLSAIIPDISISAIDRKSAARRTEKSNPVTTYGLFQTNINITMLFRKPDLDEDRRLQQDHVKISDERTSRTSWLVLDPNDPVSFPGWENPKLRPPTMALPLMPEPVADLMLASEGSSLTSNDHRVISHKSSFLSFTNSSFRNINKNDPERPTTGTGFQFSDAQSEYAFTDYSQDTNSHLRSFQSAHNITRYHDPDLTVPSNDVPHSKPWLSNLGAMPRFHYYKIIPDSSHLPSLPKLTDRKENITDDSSFLGDVDDKEIAYSDFFCEVQPGLQGFCTPEFFQIFSSILEGMQSNEPIDLIDSLQIGVISDISRHQKAKMKQPKSTSSFSVIVPSAILTVFSRPDWGEDDSQPHLQDQYQVSCTRLKITMQKKSERQEHDLIKDGRTDMTLYSAVETLSLSAVGGQMNPLQDRAELRCSLSEIVFWSAISLKNSFHLQMRTFEIVNSTKSAAPLPYLIQRTTTLADSITSSLKSLPSTINRLRYSVWFITDSAVGVPDPLFVTRPAYVLRGLQSHLRLHDSWKIISRLRHMYQNLSLEKQDELRTTCFNLGYDCPGGARDMVLQNFNEWRPWDLAHVEKSHVMRKIWGDDTNSTTSGISVTLSCNIQTIYIVIEPGPKQCDIKVVDMSAAIAFTSTLRNASDVGFETSSLKNLICIRTYCSSSTLRLRWEILDLVEGIVEAMSTTQLTSTEIQPLKTDNHKPPEVSEIHVFIGTDDASISLDGINLELFLRGYGLKGSIVFSPTSEKQQEQATILFSAEDYSTIISSHSKSLMTWELWQPHIYGSRLSVVDQKQTTNEWKLACSCRNLIYDLQEDPLGFVHAADRLVEDEVRYVRDLIQRFNTSSNVKLSSESAKDSKESLSIHQVHIALFLDDYLLNFRLLPSLIYSIDGRVARMSVWSNIDNDIEIDFDVKKNNHIFRTVEKEQSQSVSEINIPPINGRLSGRMSTEIISLNADVTVELIRLEASALRGLLDVVRRPEISHYISDCSDSMNELCLHLNDVLANTEASPQSSVGPPQRELSYKIRLTMAGWKIHARALGLKDKDYSADMNFALGTTQVHLDSSQQNLKSDSPNFHVNVSHIGLELIKHQHSRAQSYGSLGLDVGLRTISQSNEHNQTVQLYELSSKGLIVELYAETASLVIDIAAHLQNRIKNLDLSEDMKRLRYLGDFARVRNRGTSGPLPESNVKVEDSHSPLFLNALFSVELSNIQASWIMDEQYYPKAGFESEDLVFSIRRVTLSTSGDNSAKLRIQDTQLQIVPKGQDKGKRSLNSALMPEIVFNVAYLFTKDELRLAFQAAGKALDLRSTTGFLLPANLLQSSIASAAERLREANTLWSTSPSESSGGNALLGNRHLSSLLVDVDFAGAVLTLLGRQLDDQQTRLAATVTGKRFSEGRYGQYVLGDPTTTASLTSPGVALKVQFGDNGVDDPTLNGELRVSPSSNTLFPTVVPLIKQISASIKEVVGDSKETNLASSSLLQTPKKLEDSAIDATNAQSILGRCKLNLGLRISKQEFSLSCQPIARVAATAHFEDIFMTVNTVQSPEQRRFFAILIACNDLQVSVKHVYSNESTASFEVQSMVMSLMNSKHVSTSSGISAILKVSPVKTILNAKQVQDLLLFREIWVPSDDDETFPTAGSMSTATPSDSQTLMVQRYQQVAAADAFPWNAVISIDELDIQLDLGQTLGKADFIIKNFWVSSKKTSDWEQNLCGGFDVMAIESKGRMSGSVTLEKMRVRTSIRWPDESPEAGQTPLIQASIGFGQLQANTSFEYQPFLVADIVAFDFLMYNVRSTSKPAQDRLVSILEGEKVQVFCTTLTASQSLALYQTWQRLAQDKYAAYEASLKEIERFFRRKSTMMDSAMSSPAIPQVAREEKAGKSPIKLHTNVVVTLRAVNIGTFPSTFFDNQIFKMEALDAQARFAVSFENEKIHSSLGLTLGQLRVALSSVNRPTAVEMKELSVEDVATRATGSRGGTILKVPRVVASMQTWQSLASNEIEYIFKSAFEGKVDVGWNYSRISFIRGMWLAHSRALAERLGKPLPPSAVRITGGPKPGDHEHEDGKDEPGAAKDDQNQPSKDEKITAVVDVPQSKYKYVPLEPPLIETPQLRDMGEATPPLEWIGLNRDRLPNVTHQIIIVTLLELAKEVSDAYSQILG